MRGKVNEIVWFLVVVFPLIPVYAQYGGGTGEINDPYLIYSAEQMNAIGAEPNDWDKHFKLMADIDLKDLGDFSFNLIGTSSQPFKGVFNGNGHTISNLTYIVTGDEDEADSNFMTSFGLFRYIHDPNAVIKDLGLMNPDLRPASTCPKRLWYVGALVGSLSSGSISHCYVEGGHVYGERWVGGLVGSNRGTISDCYTTCLVRSAEERSLVSVSQSVDEREFFGGLAGVSLGEINNCYTVGEVFGENKVGGLVGEGWGMVSDSWSGSHASGDVDIGGLIGKSRSAAALSHCSASGHISGRKSIGGLVGYCKGSVIMNCNFTGIVSAEESGGGMVGSHEGTLSECYSTAFVIADANNVGGLVGINLGTILKSWAGGYVTGKKYIGGLVGFNVSREDVFSNFHPIITNSYARGKVYGEDYVGGLVGFNQGGAVSKCYSIAKVTGITEDSWVGGLVAVNNDYYPGEIEDSFWDTITSGVDRSEGGMGKTTVEMQDMWMYLNTGWDFKGEMFNGMDDLWKICCGRSIYPKLAWEEILVGDFVDPEGVDWLDLAFLADHWLQTVALPCNKPDVTFDARVDIEDLALMAQYWGCGVRETIFETALDESPGWVTEGQWQFGAPTGGGGSVEGHPDPNSGYTGDNVYGVNLQGDYTVAIDGPHYLTAGPFDRHLYRDVKLEFARWLNTDESDYVHTTVEFSFDGIIWAPVWEYEDREAILTDDAWRVVVYNFGRVADHRESLYIRWSYEVKDVEAWPMSGWNIDDVRLTGIR